MTTSLAGQVLRCTLLLLLWACATQAQEMLEGDVFQRLKSREDGKGYVHIAQPPSLARAMRLAAQSNAKQPALQGYRVRVYRNVGKVAREASQNIQNELLNAMPGMPVYRTYDAPNYKVAVGDFRTRYEALYFRKKLLQKYPQAFVIAELINFPSTRTADTITAAEQSLNAKPQ